MPPLHISSSSVRPEWMRSSALGALRAVFSRVITTMPECGTIVKGNSPVRWSTPRIFSTSMVRRRVSSSSALRSTITLSQTNSSTPWRPIWPYSSARSLVTTAVTPSSRSSSVTRISSRRTTLASW